MSTGNATVETLSPEMNQVNDTLVDFVPKQYVNGHRHVYELDEAGKKAHVSRQYAHDKIEDAIVGAYGGDIDTASDALLADYGHRAHGAKLVAEPVSPVTNITTARERRSGREFLKKHPLIGKAAVALAFVGTLAAGFNSQKGSGDNSRDTHSIELAVANNNPEAQIAAVSTTSTTETTTTEAPSSTLPQRGPLSQAELEFIYGAGGAGERGTNELGNFEIVPGNAEKSLENMFTELRHNKAATAQLTTCIETTMPSWEACVSNPAAREMANELRAHYEQMDLVQYATVAESLIAQIQKAEFAGISTENGEYKTVAVDADGNFIPATNMRYNDLRLNFVFEYNGVKYPLQIRSCVQITENEVPTPPEIVTPPTTVPTPPTTATTVPPTTTTTEAPTTTTTAQETTTTEATTTTTEEETTTTKVTTPKTDPTNPENEVTTTVVVGDPTPIDPTTTTVSQEPTSSTAPAEGETTTTDDVAVEPDPINPNMDLVNPFSLGIGGLTAWIIKQRKKLHYMRNK